MHQCLADLCTIVVVKPLLCDRRIHFDLTVDGRLDILHSDLIGKIQDILHCKKRFVNGCCDSRLIRIVKDHLAVLLNPCDVGVLMLDRDRSGVLTTGNDGCDKKIINTFDQGTGTDFLCDELAGPGNILRGDFTEYLKGTVGITADDTKNCRYIDSFESAGIGNSDTLDILDDVATQVHFHMLRELSEDLPGFCRCIGNGDRFCTSKGRNKLLFQDVQIVCI